MHNLYYYNELVKGAREAIREGRYSEFKKDRISRMKE